MKPIYSLALLLTVISLLPAIANAQVSTGINQLHDVLNNVYNQMVPMCADLIQVCQAIAGIGTLFYIGVRVWKHLARAEAIDMFPLFRRKLWLATILERLVNWMSQRQQGSKSLTGRRGSLFTAGI